MNWDHYMEKRRKPLSEKGLREKISQILKEVDVVISWKMGFDPIHATPHFIRDEKEIEESVFNVFCVHNLTTYLPFMKEKVGIVVKGCDSRTLVQFIQEGLITRENLKIIGIPCSGVVDVKKIMEEIGESPVLQAEILDNSSLKIRTLDGEKFFQIDSVLAQKCKTCRYPTPLIYDHLIGEPIKSQIGWDKAYEDVTEFDKKTLEEKLSFWKKEFEKCIRCYACRNACPLCVCQDRCIAESRDPHFVSQKLELPEKFMFHFIHAIHLAGRCVECGECERACPMGIPVKMMKKKINYEMKQLFDYETGINVDDKPPMYTFKVEEEKIKEHEL